MVRTPSVEGAALCFGAVLGICGLSASWEELTAALRGVRAQGRDDLPLGEMQQVEDLIREAERALQR